MAVDDISIRIRRGEIVALLGPNGAGKTTTLKMCGTMQAPSSGSLRIDGLDARRNPRAARARLGIVLGGEGGFYARASARKNLLFFADVAGIPGRQRKGAVERSLSAVGLGERGETRVREFSRGMKQRLHLARGLLRTPRLLLLDEPTNGLDPEYSLEMRTQVREVAATGTGLLLTTHLLAEAEALADHVIVIDKGRILVQGEVRDIGLAAGLSLVTEIGFPSGSASIASLKNRWESTAVSISEQAVFGRVQFQLQWSDARGERAFREWVAEVEDPTDRLRVETRPPTLEESYLALTTSHESER